MWKNIVEMGRPQMTMWCMRIACWMPKATNTHSKCVIYIAFLLPEWLHESASMLHYGTFSVLLQNKDQVLFRLSFKNKNISRDICH